ncbi:DUF3667 domain-containing protein [Sphingosinicella sp.]|uniref:DUF3667 domain-containing protein n=1 Tax=Sphingosinicella sp. TaxID=1917971 RepID=UPI0040376198
MLVTEGVEGIGEAVTGGMVARAVEPQAGEASEAGERNCLNCAASLDGPYCRQCGQKAHVHRSVGAIVHDLVHGILHLDGKFWRTLPMLAWRPGELTRRYVHGERAKFVSPMAMFLFSVFLMFAVLSIYGLSLTSLGGASTAQIQRGMTEARTEMVRELDEARQDRVRIAAGEVRRHRGQPETLPQIDARIAEMQRDIAEFDRVLASTTRLGIGGSGTGTTLQTGWRRLDYGLQKFNENPSLALYKLQSNGYKFSWLLIPLSVPFVWLLFFWTRRFHFYDHTVFVTYSIAFMSLLAIVLTVLGFAGAPTAIIASAAVFLPPIHMFRQLKGAYGLGWFGALVRTFLLVNFCFITASLFFVLLLGLGALG